MEQKRESVKMTGGKTHSSCWGKKPPLYKRVPCVSCTETISISAVFLHRPFWWWAGNYKEKKVFLIDVDVLFLPKTLLYSVEKRIGGKINK